MNIRPFIGDVIRYKGGRSHRGHPLVIHRAYTVKYVYDGGVNDPCRIGIHIYL